MPPSGNRQRLRRGLLAGVSAVVLAVLAFTTWQAAEVRSSLQLVATRLTTAVENLSDGRTSEATAAVDDARDAAGSAYTHSRGPVWWLAAKLPWIGDDVTAVRVVSSVSRNLTADTLPALVEASGAFGPDALDTRRGRIDLAPIASTVPALEAGAADIARASGRVDQLDTRGLVDGLRGPVDDLADKLRKGRATAEHAATAAHLLPTMLGGEERRTYLMVFQNNAEIRAQGGMPGAFAVLTARNGKVRMVQQGRPRDIGVFPDADVAITPEERELFTERIAVYPQDTNFIPDFPRSSELLKEMWERRQPRRLDGILSIDPVAMSYLLRGTGPVTLDSGERLTADNAAEFLLSDVYWDVPGDDAQNAVFDETARKVFDTLLHGSPRIPGLLSGLSQAASERRLMVWSAHDDEQARIADTPIAGALPTSAGARPEIGVYFNDAAADKLSYYLDYRVDIAPQTCTPDRRQTLGVRLTLKSTVPEGELPPEVRGPLDQGHPPGMIRHSISVYAPVDGHLASATIDGAEVALAQHRYRGRQVVSFAVYLDRGQERVVDYRFVTGPEQGGRAHLVTTPGATTTGHGTVGASSC